MARIKRAMTVMGVVGDAAHNVTMCGLDPPTQLFINITKLGGRLKAGHGESF
jgi:hypothetical protein